MEAGVPVMPGRKTADIYELIRSDVVSGRLVPGQRLSEASLGRQYGVSRSPVREALALLLQDGLVRRSGLVTYVRERSAEEILDIYQVRIYLEGAIAGDAAQRRQPADLRRLGRAVEAGESASPGDPDALMSANRIFHDALIAACHNATLAELQGRLTAQVAVLPATTLSVPGRWARSMEEHRLIVRAVAAGDAGGAREVAERHMEEARNIRLQLFERDFPHSQGIASQLFG